MSWGFLPSGLYDTNIFHIAKRENERKKQTRSKYNRTKSRRLSWYYNFKFLNAFMEKSCSSTETKNEQINDFFFDEHFLIN